MEQRFLDPSIAARISGLDLVAKTVVDGFLAAVREYLALRGGCNFRGVI